VFFIANRWRGELVLVVCYKLKGFPLDFNPVAHSELSSPAGFHFAIYFDDAIQYEEFCFNSILGNIGKLKELGKADGVRMDGNSSHISGH
jgi:hypothetical protein